mmetsp:Transcript_30187/g.63967  ORF Transcript_30187/g.63967 Transcript_30187/m.63967 type:complete len:104 (+) Transcript_30187:825-1136(+)
MPPGIMLERREEMSGVDDEEELLSSEPPRGMVAHDVDEGRRRARVDLGWWLLAVVASVATHDRSVRRNGEDFILQTLGQNNSKGCYGLLLSYCEQRLKVKIMP